MSSSGPPPGFPGAMPAPPEPELRARIRAHIGIEPVALPIVAEGFDTSEQPNLQLALDAWLAEEGRSGELLGVISDHRRFMGLSMSELLAPARGPMMGPPPPSPGPVEYVNITIADGRVLQCVQSGLYLLRDGDEPFAASVSGPVEQGPRREVRVEVTARTPEAAGRLLGQLRELLRRHNVYRGHVLSLTADMYGGFGMRFHQLPDTGRDGIILPEDVLERVERHTLRFAQHHKRLLAAGQHLKRGLLLHGPPGTGKTLTAMYLATQMRDRTILLLTGRSLGLLQRTTAMARILQPSMVILEDVDLIAEERTRSPMGSTPLLFELLNEMDGLASDADVIFLLTSNRPDLLEPALAARPGRIDQAIEIPLPDTGCRQRLFDLYGRSAGLQVDDWDRLVVRTEGVSGAFIRELVRKAILFAAERDDAVVGEQHLDDALHELVVAGGDLTRSLLGAREAHDA
ncbi:MAG: AAA family ATPase [Thermomicrobiales bacterium]